MRLTTEQKLEMVRLYNLPQSIVQVAAVFNVTPACVWKVIKKHGIARTGLETKKLLNIDTGTQHLSDEQLEFIKTEYNTHRSIPKIARALSVTDSAIVYRLQHWGLYKSRKQTKQYPNFLHPYLQTKIKIANQPPVIAVVKNLAVVVVDPMEWDVETIFNKYCPPNLNQASMWFQQLKGQLNKMNLQLLMLWKDELASPGLETLIKHKTGQNIRICHTRECSVTNVDCSVANEFYERYHLQGGCNGKFHLGLYFNNQLVACMTFAHAAACRGTSGDYLLQRFAAAGNVPGAASKLFSSFTKINSGSILSYSDERYAPGGGLYNLLGFKTIDTNTPDYRYFRQGRWYAKNAKQKKHLEIEYTNTFNAPPMDETEFSMASKLGYKRCYDLGKITWLYAPEAALDKPTENI